MKTEHLIYEEDDKRDWTHKGIKIRDVRKIKDFYIISIPDDRLDLDEDEYFPGFIGPLMVKDHIFESRLRSYFLKEPSDISRDDILKIRWNLFVTKGYYIKAAGNKIEKFPQSPNKYYVSYLEVDGDLGEFNTILKPTE